MASGTELAKAYVQIIPSADGIKGKLTNVLNGEAGTAGTSAGKVLGSNLASTIKNVILTAGIGTVIKETLTEGADLQQSLGGIETLFKDNADEVKASAREAYKNAGMSANAYMETVTSFSASLIQGLAGDTRKAADIADMALTDMSDNANKMGTSMDLIQNAYQGFAKQNYTMLDNLKLGYGGTKTEMERLLADATALSGVEYDMSNLADVYEAIHVIQEEMGITGTTAKEAASTFWGSFDSMKASFSNVFGSLALGEDIKPAMDALLSTTRTFLVDNFFPMVGNVLSGLTKYIRDIVVNTDWKAVMAQLGTKISESLSGIVQDNPILGEFSAIFSEIYIAIEPYIAEISDVWQEMTALFSETYNADIKPVIDEFIVMLGELWVENEDKIGLIVEFFRVGFEQMAIRASWFYENIIKKILIPAIQELATWVSENMDTIKAIFQATFDVIGGMVEFFTAFLEADFEGMWEAIQQINETGKELLLKIWEQLKSSIQEKIEKILSVAKSKFENMKDDMVNKVTDAKTKVLNVFEKIKDGISDKINSAKETVKKAIEKIKSYFDFEWSLPRLKLPHISISGSWSMNPPSAPDFDIDWYAKAMNHPIIMNSPTAFGINSLGQIMAGGEAGSEVVSGTDTLMRMIAEAVSSQNGALADIMNNGFGNLMAMLYEYLPQLANMQLVTDTGVLIGELAPGMDEELGKIARRNGREV